MLYFILKEGDIMGSKYTEAQAKAVQKHHASKRKIQILVEPEEGDLYKQKAAAKGLSLSAFIKKLLDEA